MLPGLAMKNRDAAIDAPTSHIIDIVLAYFSRSSKAVRQSFAAGLNRESEPF